MNLHSTETEARAEACAEAREAVRRYRDDRDVVVREIHDAELALVALPPVSFEMTISEVEARGVLRDRLSELRHSLDVIDHRIALNALIADAFPSVTTSHEGTLNG